MTEVTEFATCERTKDAWLRSTQDEFRFGTLTEESHAFLNGQLTMQPGSVLNGNIRCGKHHCTKISSKAL